MSEATATMILSECEARELLDDILHAEGICADEVIIDEGKQKGDGYLSCITKLDVFDKTKAKELHVVVKCAPKLEQFREMTRMDQIYQREVKFYTEIWPIYKQLQAEHNVKEPFDAVAKCYKTCTDDKNEYLVLENIKMHGFKMWNRLEPMNEQHIRFLLKQYGKFHALSYALQHHKKEVYDNLIADIDEMLFNDTLMKQGMFKDMIELSINNVKNLFSPDETVYAALDKLAGNLLNTFDEIIMKEKFSAICHGDCWCNNMMFKYDQDEQTPSKLCLLDFQIVRISSPVLDLSYFYYVSGDPKAFDSVDAHLKIYYESLINSLEVLHFPDAANFMSFADLQQQWRKYAKFGFIMASMVLRASMSEADELMDFHDMIDEVNQNTDLSEFMNKKRKNDDVINYRLKAVAQQLFNYGCLN